MHPTRLVAAFLAAALALLWPVGWAPALAAPADYEANWMTKGKTPERRNATLESLGPLKALKAWEIEIGLSGSQPVYVDGAVYHVAGDALWRVTPDGQATALLRGVNTLPDGRVRPSTSGVTYATVGGRRLLYFGSGSNRVYAFDLDTHWYNWHQLTGDEPIVSTPLVLTASVPGGGPTDLVVMGDKGGRLWVIQGLGTARTRDDVRAAWIPVDGGAWVTATATPASDPAYPLDFIWAADGTGSPAGNGLVARFRIVPGPDGPSIVQDRAERVWLKRTPCGVADGFATDGTYAYFADVCGNMYRVRLADGDYQVIPAQEPMFTNISPAVSDYPNVVYFAIRNVHGRGGDPKPAGRPSYTNPGRVVAVDRRTWAVRWTADLPAPANTAPLVWMSENAVLVGDAAGAIHAFNLSDGGPQEFARQLVGEQGATGKWWCDPLFTLNLLNPGESPYRAPHAYQQLNGSGTDPILATGGTGQGLLLVGANALRSDGTPSGRLVAFRAGGTYNTRWIRLEIGGRLVGLGDPGDPIETGEIRIEPGKKVTIDATAAMTGGEGSRDMTVEFLYVRQDGRVMRLEADPGMITLATGQEARIRVEWTPGQDAAPGGLIVGVLNPEETLWSWSYPGKWLRGLKAAYFRSEDTQVGWRTAEILDMYDQQTDPELTEKILYDNRLPGRCEGGFIETEIFGGIPIPAIRDNFVKIPIRVEEPIDLEMVRVEAQAEVKWVQNGDIPVTFVVRNSSTQRVASVLQVDASYARTGGEWHSNLPPISWKPGENRISLKIPMQRGDDTIQITATVDPDNRVKETDEANNRATAAVRVGPEPEVPTGEFRSGPSDVMVVPPDCIPTTDPEDPRPCQNPEYRDLYYPWYCRQNPWVRGCEGYR